MTDRAVQAQQEPVTAIRGPRSDPERGVLLISDTPQLPTDQRIRLERPHGHPPHPGNPPPIRHYDATVPPQGSAWQRPAGPAATPARGGQALGCLVRTVRQIRPVAG